MARGKHVRGSREAAEQLRSSPQAREAHGASEELAGDDELDCGECRDNLEGSYANVESHTCGR